jgi:hypothetical protein
MKRKMYTIQVLLDGENTIDVDKLQELFGKDRVQLVDQEPAEVEIEEVPEIFADNNPTLIRVFNNGRVSVLTSYWEHIKATAETNPYLNEPGKSVVELLSALTGKEKYSL